MKHDRLTEQGQELAALYALGSLTQQEARAFESHIEEGCEICRSEMRRYEQVVGLLGSAAPPVEPPASLRSKLGARIASESQPVAFKPSTEAAQVIRFPESPKSAPKTSAPVWRMVLPWAVAAMLVVALGYALTTWQSERRALRASVDGYRNEAAALKDRLTRESSRASSELAEINSILASPQSSRIAMSGLDAAPAASANIYWDVQGRRWAVAANLPPAPAGKVYQLWFVTPDAKISAGLIKPDDQGHGFTVINIPPDVTKVAAAAITLEPEGGSAQPTMPIYLLGKVA